MSETANRKLQAIGVRTESSTGNVTPLLYEIRHALTELAERGHAHIIDMKALPLTGGDLDAILTALGEGEVRAELGSLGRSEIRETSYPGVWLVTHFDEQGDVKARFIEITRMPAILESQASDIAEGLARLESALPEVRIP